jgi:hypothetical protein
MGSGTAGAGGKPMAATMNGNSRDKRILVKELDGRVAELENRIRELSEHIQRVDQRLQRTADLLALSSVPRV